MSVLQVLRAGRASQSSLGYRVHHGSGGLVQYSSASAAAEAPNSSRSFCLSTEKVTMQQLNGRLASYLQQVQCLEVANQELESLIQKELDRKCPRELKELDGHLRTVSLLQDQITESLSAQAQVKLQLLNAELTVFDLHARCQKERECRGGLEAELSDLRLLEEELQVHKLPELQRLVIDQNQQLEGLQIQHKQDLQGLLAQMSGGVTVEMHPVESLDLIRQLDDLRQTSVRLLDKNQNEHWFNPQGSTLSSPEAMFDSPAGSDPIQAAVEDLRRRAVSLEEELRQLQALKGMLEAHGLEQDESFVQQLSVLQQRADGLCRDLNSVLEAAAQLTADHQTLLDVTTRLETEIEEYRRLLDGLSSQGVPSLHLNSAADAKFFRVKMSPSDLKRNITVSKTGSVKGGNLGNFRMAELPGVSRSNIHTVGQTPVAVPLPETVTRVQSIRVHSKHPKTAVASINTSNRGESFNKSENQKTEVLHEITKRESMTNVTIKKSSPTVSTQISQSSDKTPVLKESKPQAGSAQKVTVLVSEKQSLRAAGVETKPNTRTSKETTEADSQANETETDIQTETTKTIHFTEPEVKQGPDLITQTTTAENREKETETVVSAQMTCKERSIGNKNQDPEQDVCFSLQNNTGTVGDAGEDAAAASTVSGSYNHRSDDKSTVSNASSPAQNKDTEDADTGSSFATASPSSPESNDNLASSTAQGIISLVNDTQSIMSDTIEAKPETLSFKETTAEADLQANKTETNIQTETAKAVLHAGIGVKQELHVVAHRAVTDVCKQSLTEEKKEAETETSAQMNGSEGSNEAKNQDLSLKTSAKAAEDVGDESQDKVSGDLTLIDVKDIDRQGKETEKDAAEEEGTLIALRLDESSAMSSASNDAQNKVIEDEDTGSETATASSSSPNSNDNLESSTAQVILSLSPDTLCVRSDIVEAKQDIFTSRETTTETDLQDNNTETDIKTETAQASFHAEPEVKRGPHVVTHTEITDAKVQTSADARKETETGISAQINVSEGSIEDTNQDSSQGVSLHQRTSTKDAEDAGEVVVKASSITESQIIRSKMVKGEASGDLTLMDDKDTKRQEKRTEKEVSEEEGTLIDLRLDESSAMSNASNRAQNKVTEDEDTSSGIATASSGSSDSNDNLEPLAAQGTISLAHGTPSVESETIEAENFTSKKADLQVNKPETIFQTETAQAILNAEPEVKQEPHVLSHMRISDSSKQIPAEPQKETETEISSKINGTKDSIPNQDLAQLVSSSLETPTEIVRDAGKAPDIHGSHILRSEEVQVKVSDELTLIDGKGKEKKQEEVEGILLVPRLDQSLALPDASKVKQNIVTENADKGSGTAADSLNNLESKTASTESLIKAELEVNKGKVVNRLHDADNVKVDLTKSDTEVFNLAGQEELSNIKESKKSTSRIDSGVALSFSDTEDQSQREAHVSVTPTKLEICLSPIEREVLLSMTDQVFGPADEEEHVRSRNSLLSPSDSELCLSPVEAKPGLIPSGEEDEEECQSLTEANVNVRPVEKYVLSTKEEGQSLSFSNDQALPEKGRVRKVSIKVEDGDSLCFGSFEGNKKSPDAGQGNGPQCGGLKSAGPACHSITAGKEDQLRFGGQRKDSDCTTDNKDVQSPGVSQGGRYDSEDAKETSNMSGNSKRVLNVKSASFGSVPANEGDTLCGVATNSGGKAASNNVVAKDLSSSSSSTNSSAKVSDNAAVVTTAGVGGRFRSDSGEWMISGGSLGHRSTTLPNAGSKESASSATLPATSQQERGRFSSRGSGEWLVYGSSSGRKSSLDGSTSLASKGKQEGPLVATSSATNPQDKWRFGSGGSGEWKVQGENSGHMSSWAGNHNLPNADREKIKPVTAQPPTSPPGSVGTGRFGSGGSGEWKVYGGSSGRMSSWAGSSNLSNTDRQEIPSDAAKLPTSPPGSLGTGRFGSEGSGEWRVYGGGSGRMSSRPGNNNLPKNDREEFPSNASKLPISPPGSLRTGRFGSEGSGEWKVYGGGSGRMSSRPGNNNLPNADTEKFLSNAAKLPTSPPGSLKTGRFGSEGSGEWRVYGGSSGRLSSASSSDRVSAGQKRMFSPPNSHTGSGTRLRSVSSSRPSSSGVVRRSSSVGSGGRLSSSGSGGRLSSSSGSHRMSTSGRCTSPGSGEWRPVYSSAGARSSSQRAPSPGGRTGVGVGGGGWASSSTSRGTPTNSQGSGSKLSGAAGGDRMSSSSGSGRTNSTGGRVISSSDRPIRSTGSGAGGSKERISVCKMAALSISAAGRERSQDRQRQQQQQQQQQAAGSSPLLQRWLNTGF